jgi:ribose transport system permease protein
MSFRDIIERYGTALAGLLLFAIFAAIAPRFLDATNLLNVFKHASVLAIFALGVTLALVTAELDLSFANVASLAAVVTGYLVHKGDPIALAIAAGLGVGTLAGFLNGLLVTQLKIPSLIATLGTAAIANGFAFMATAGVAFVGRWPVEFTRLARGNVLGIPAPVIWAGVASGVALFVLKQTRLGLHMTATGDADEAARLAGVATKRMKLIGMTLSGLCAGIGALMLTANLSSAAPNMAGDYLLQAIAAVLLGMTMVEPGHPNVPGSLAGALILAILNNGLVLVGAPYFMQDIVLGVTIVAAVGLSASVLKRAAFSVG